MGITAVAGELAGRDELEGLFRLDASESAPEDDEQEEDDYDDEDEAEDDKDDDEGVKPEGMPHD